MDHVLKGARVLAIEDDGDILATYAAIFAITDTTFRRHRRWPRA